MINRFAVDLKHKGVSARIRGAKTELEAAGEDTDGLVENTSKLRDLVKGMTGFDIMTDAAGTQYKDMYEIIVGIGEAWKDLEDIDQAALLEALAGKNQANALAAALNNIETIKAAYQSAEFESAGSAMRENERYMASIQGRIAQLTSTFQELSANLLNSDLFKGIVSGATDALKITNEFIETIGVLPTILGGVGIAAFIKNFA